MDRISAFLPPIGWSPLAEVAPQTRAPASTVEPPHASARAHGGADAGVDARSGQPRRHAQQPRGDGTPLPAVAVGTGTPLPPDPDQPTGPAPTFDLTYLEAEALRRRAGQKRPHSAAGAPEPGAAGEPPGSARAPDIPPGRGEDAPADGNRANAAPAWPRMDGTPATRLDLTR